MIRWLRTRRAFNRRRRDERLLACFPAPPGETTARALADAAGLSMPAVYVTLSRLEVDGRVESRSSAGPGRRPWRRVPEPFL